MGEANRCSRDERIEDVIKTDLRRRLSGCLKVASLNWVHIRESSNQLLETLEEWNDYLER